MITGNHQTNNMFQFTPLREGRPGSRLVLPSDFLFQFTPLREGRRASSCSAVKSS